MLSLVLLVLLSCTGVPKEEPSPAHALDAMLASPAPDLVGPVAGLELYSTLEEARRVVPKLQLRLTAPEPFQIDANTYDGLGPDGGEITERVHSVRIWLPPEITPEVLESHWGAPRVAKSASGTFLTWINESKRLRATYWKDPHPGGIELARLLVSEWRPFEAFFSQPLHHWLARSQRELHESVGNRLSKQNHRVHEIVLGATGADSRIWSLLLRHDGSVVHEVVMHVETDEDRTLDHALHLQLANYGFSLFDPQEHREFADYTVRSWSTRTGVGVTVRAK